MRPFHKAGLVWLALLALGVAAQRGEAPEPSRPRWPVLLRVTAPHGGALCASRELSRALRERAFEFVAVPGTPAPDSWPDRLELKCVEEETGAQASIGGFELASSRRREPVYSDAFELRGSSRGERERLADELAERLAVEPAVAVEAEAVFLDGQKASAKAGAAALREERWEPAARLLYQGLEGEVADETLYGLTISHAELGHAELAWWYWLAFARRTREPVDERPALLGSLRPGERLDAEASGLYAEARRLIEAGRLRQAFVVLKLACERVPWDDRPADAVAALYDELGWKAVSARWRERAALAREIKALADRGKRA